MLRSTVVSTEPPCLYIGLDEGDVARHCLLIFLCPSCRLAHSPAGVRVCRPYAPVRAVARSSLVARLGWAPFPFRYLPNRNPRRISKMHPAFLIPLILLDETDNLNVPKPQPQLPGAVLPEQAPLANVPPDRLNRSDRNSCFRGSPRSTRRTLLRKGVAADDEILRLVHSHLRRGAGALTRFNLAITISPSTTVLSGRFARAFTMPGYFEPKSFRSATTGARRPPPSPRSPGSNRVSAHKASLSPPAASRCARAVRAG